MKPAQPKPAPKPDRKWWKRYGDGDWRWSDQSWQTEQQAVEPQQKGEK